MRGWKIKEIDWQANELRRQPVSSGLWMTPPQKMAIGTPQQPRTLPQETGVEVSPRPKSLLIKPQWQVE